jgi:murein endopeptidase
MIQFVSTDQGDAMSITGTYASRLQSAAFAMIKGLNDIADRIAESGGAGSYSSAPIKGAIPMPQQRETPRRLRESTGFGELR